LPVIADASPRRLCHAYSRRHCRRLHQHRCIRTSRARKRQWPNYQEGDFVIVDDKFASGESLPQLKLHYRTLGTAQRNTGGEINGVLLLQGNTGTGANWLRPSLADELFKDGQPLPDQLHGGARPDGSGGRNKMTARMLVES